MSFLAGGFTGKFTVGNLVAKLRTTFESFSESRSGSHGKQRLASLQATLIILAYLMHTALEWLDQKFLALRQIFPSRRNVAVMIFFNILLRNGGGAVGHLMRYDPCKTRSRTHHDTGIPVKRAKRLVASAGLKTWRATDISASPFPLYLTLAGFFPRLFP